MTQYTKPTVLPAWAESAGGADVLQPSNAEIQAGWPLSNVPPSRKRFNWVLKYLAQGVRYLLQRGIPEWDSAEDYRINDRVQGSNGKTYRCIQAGVNQDPTTQTAYWALWGSDGRDDQLQLTTAFTTAGTAPNFTLTPVPAPTALTANLRFRVKFHAAGAGSNVINIAGLGNKSVKQYDSTGSKVAATIVANQLADIEYDGTDLVILDPLPPAVSINQIQTVGASVGSNGMTVTLNPTSLDFRSTTQNSGAVNKRTVASQLSLTIPSTATLGTSSGVASRILVIAIDNAGTVELAVYNAAGGASLDETGLISTTAIAAGSNSLTVYSQTARTNVPYRIVGFVDSTQATAGIWAAAPSAVQGIGGQALAAMSSIGYGQTWQDVTGSRASGTTYYNTTGKPIAISIRIGITGTSTNYLAVNGVTIAQNSGNGTGSGVAQIVAIVPPGGNYLYTAGGGSVIAWNELR